MLGDRSHSTDRKSGQKRGTKGRVICVAQQNELAVHPLNGREVRCLGCYHVVSLSVGCTGYKGQRRIHYRSTMWSHFSRAVLRTSTVQRLADDDDVLFNCLGLEPRLGCEGLCPGVACMVCKQPVERGEDGKKPCEYLFPILFAA